MNNLLKQAQKVQQEMQKVQDSLADITVEGSAGGGMVKAVANCKLEILSVSIEPEVVDPDDKEMLEDLVTAATNAALDKAREGAAEEMAQITGGLNIPGLDEALTKFNPNS